MNWLISNIVSILGLHYGKNLRYTNIAYVCHMFRRISPLNIVMSGVFQSVAITVGLIFLFDRPWPDPNTKENVGYFIVIASLWGVISPALIWNYERNSTLKFLRSYRKFVGIGGRYKEVRREALANVKKDTSAKFIISTWVISCSIIFLLGGDYIQSLGISGVGDWLWWYIFVGVILFSYYTSIGICYSIKTVKVCSLIYPSSKIAEIYRTDNKLGLSFVGRFSQETTIPFLSGWMFAPILYSAYTLGSDFVSLFSLILFVIYQIFVAFTFFWPIFIVKRHVNYSKDEWYRLTNLKIREIIASKNGVGDIDYDAFNFHRNVRSDIDKISPWPLGLQTFARFLSFSILVPLIVGIATNSMDVFLRFF